MHKYALMAGKRCKLSYAECAETWLHAATSQEISVFPGISFRHASWDANDSFANEKRFLTYGAPTAPFRKRS